MGDRASTIEALGSAQSLKRRWQYPIAAALVGVSAAVLLWLVPWKLFFSGYPTGNVLTSSLALVPFALTFCLAFAILRTWLITEPSKPATDRLWLAMESGKTVGWDWDVRSGRDTWFGDLENMFGVKSRTYSGSVEDFRRRVHPEDRARVWEAVSQALRTHTTYSAEFRVVRTDATIRWVSAKGHFYYSPTGQARRMLGMAADITELKNAQRALHESEERLRIAAQVGKMFAYSWDAATDVIERSGESAEILGVEEARQLTGEQAIAAVHPEDREKIKMALTTLTPEKPFLRAAYRMIRPDSRVIWVERNSRAYFDDHGKIVRIVGMVADITDRKIAEDVMASISRRLIEAQETERVRIARDLHDDIGQRLAVCALDLERLRQRSADASGEQAGWISQIQSNLSEISTSLHTLSHELHPAMLDLLGLVAAMRASCRELSGKQNAEIQFSDAGIGQPLTPEVSLCLFRVLQEALHNALKHSGVRKVAVELRGTHESVDLIVRDAGVGFDPALICKTPGLGLTSMRERLKLVSGELFIRSEVRRGTTIIAHIPIIARI
jgi:PAS domain S-box-containing protein